MVDRVLYDKQEIYYRHVDLSSEPRGRDYFFRLGGGSIPYTVLVGPDEEPIADFRGYRDEGRLESWLESHGF